MNERCPHYFRWIVLVLAVAFALRLGAAFWWESRVATNDDFSFGDSYSYWILAERIADGQTYEYGPGQARIFRAPGYPLLLSTLFLFDGEPSVLSARIMGTLFGTLAVGGVIWLTRRLFSQRASIVAGVFATLYPGAIGMSVFVLTEAPFCPFMLGQILAWVAAFKSDNRRRTLTFALLAGLCAGAATLIRPSWLLFAPFAWCFAMLPPNNRRRQLLIGVTMACGIIVAMTPWWVRNYQVTSRLVLTTTQFGASLYDGLNARTVGDSDMSFVDEFVTAQQNADATTAGPLTGSFEERLDNRMRDAAVSWARKHPGDAIQLAGRKMLRMWSPWPNATQFQSVPFRLALLIGYLPLIVLAIGGAVRFTKRGWPFVLCLLPALYFSCLHAVFVSSIRYRQPPMLVLIVLAAGFVEMWLRDKQSSAEADPEPS